MKQKTTNKSSSDPAATVAASAIAVTASLHRSAGDVGRAAKHADADVRTVSTDDKAAAVEWKAGDAQVTISQEKLAEISEAIATLSDQSAMSSLKRDVIEVGQGIAARKVREELDAMSLRRRSPSSPSILKDTTCNHLAALWPTAQMTRWSLVPVCNMTQW
jgi:hypothetical protein